MATGEVETIAGLGHWPRGMPPDAFMREHGGKIPAGVRRTVVPAAPDAWITALARHGTMSFGDVASFAIRYARDGYAVYPLLAESIRAHAAEYARWPSNAALYLPGGRPPEVGDRFVMADLAATIQFMADEERAAAAAQGDRAAGLAAAHAAFYRGDIAQRIAAHQRAEGGWLSAEDLANFRSRLEPAVRRRWRGHEVIVCGPWCQGPSLLQALLLAERAGIAGMAHNSADYLHVLVESIKLALADREYFFGDPAFVDVPIDHLLAPETIARRAAAIRMDRAHPGMPGPLDQPVPALAASHAAMPRVEPDTSYACAVDRWGNAFSATPSDGSWAAPVVPGLGFVPSQRGAQSRPDPSHPAGAAPGKRPRLTPNPAMILPAGGGVMPFGTPGGDVQIQAMLQVLLNRFQFGMELQAAIEAPRAASYSFPSSFAPFDYFPGRLAVEGRVDPAARAELAARGHEVKDWADWTWLAGSVEAVQSDPERGLIEAGADPRRPAYGIAA
jgi:gamma-glutamyltranspeptidase/glutathione hydrolase